MWSQKNLEAPKGAEKQEHLQIVALKVSNKKAMLFNCYISIQIGIFVVLWLMCWTET